MPARFIGGDVCQRSDHDREDKKANAFSVPSVPSVVSVANDYDDQPLVLGGCGRTPSDIQTAAEVIFWTFVAAAIVAPLTWLCLAIEGWARSFMG